MSGLSLVLLTCILALAILGLTLWHCSPAGTRTRQRWHRPLLLAIPPLAALMLGVNEDAAFLSLTGPIAPAAMLSLLLPQWWLMRGTFQCRTCSAVYFDPAWGRHVAYRCQVCRGYHAHGQAFAWHRGRFAGDGAMPGAAEADVAAGARSTGQPDAVEAGQPVPGTSADAVIGAGSATAPDSVPPSAERPSAEQV